MATSGATLITELSRRLRDSGNTAHPRDLLRRVLLHCQRAVNFSEKVRKKTTVAWTPGEGRTLYRTSEIAADIARLDRIRALDHTLPEVQWMHLIDNSKTWYRDAGQPRVWARIGGNLFVLTPAQTVPVTLAVVYTTIPVDITDDATAVDLPDEWVPLLMDFAESIMLMKARLYAALDAPMARISATIATKVPIGMAKVGP